ncbi:MAG: nickel pincer cofactor biosynthesis protein LarC [Spirochaetia bacterium]|nr:nickel pincer cofactor biosynthesis protein LarC [Spirochaetia bacterium]
MAERSLYFECNTGISGDMAVAAMLDAGADRQALEKALATVPVHGFKVEISRVDKSGIGCCDFNVILDPDHENHDHAMEYLFGKEDPHHGHHEHEHEHHHHEHRNLADVLAIIDGTEMTPEARNLAHRIFGIIAQAESKAHGVPVEQVHFHEVGAVDSIVDVIALAVCFDSLKVDKVDVMRLNEGTGTVRCQHGILPIPVPAVANIASEHALPLCIMDEQGEFITPTGAAFIAAVRTHGKLPSCFTVEKVGMGAGKRNYRIPSILRAMVISSSEAQQDVIYKLETNIDDSTGEALGFVMERLFECGARDVHYIPCYMKKNRPGWLLTVICDPKDVSTMEEIIFANTTTIGIRHIAMERTVLERQIEEIDTPWGKVKTKGVLINGKKRLYPEYDSIAAICRRTGKPFFEVYNNLIGG